jgi:hypothetical protein
MNASIGKDSEDVNGSIGDIPTAAPESKGDTKNGEAKTSMVELAKTIAAGTEKLEKYLKESGSPMPGFDVDSPVDFPKLPEDLKKVREEVVRATKELEYLVTGPAESLRWKAWDVSLLYLRTGWERY